MKQLINEAHRFQELAGIANEEMNVGEHLQVGDKLQKINTAHPGTVTITKIEGDKVFIKPDTFDHVFQWSADSINDEIKRGQLKLLTKTEDNVEEGIGKTIGTAALGAALALGTPNDAAAQTPQSTQYNLNKQLPDEETVANLSNEEIGQKVWGLYKKNKINVEEWSKLNPKFISALADARKENTEFGYPYDSIEKLGHITRMMPAAVQILDQTPMVYENDSIEDVVNEALAKLREEETQAASDELTPEQIAAAKSIIGSLSEGDENASDDAKFEKLKSKLDTLPKALLTGAFIALLMSMASCSGSKGMTNCNFIQKKMSGYRE